MKGRSNEEHELIERQNDERTDQLLGKIRAIRQVSVNIYEEAEDQRSILEEMNRNFNGVGGFLQRTSRNLQNFIRTRNSSSCWKLSWAFVVIFLILYLIVKFNGNNLVNK